MLRKTPSTESAKKESPRNLYMAPELPLLLRRFRVDVVFDIGANVGQFASELFGAGFAGRIVSFEPLSAAHGQLIETSQPEPRWAVAPRCALGESDGEATIHVAANSQSSSLVHMLDRHMQAAPRSRYIGSETVEVRTLDRRPS